jgi:uncharacterized protein YvpB
MKIKILFKLLVVFFIVIGVYLFVLPPQVINHYPLNKADNVDRNSSLVIELNKPLRRKEVNFSISPKAYGQWDFEDSLIENHLFKTLIFTPAIDFEPNTQYEIKIENINNILGVGLSNNFYYSFKTKPASLSKISQNGFEKDNNDQVEASFAKQDGEELKKEPKPDLTILDIDLDWQDYKLSCEAASLKMALNWKGVYVTEEQIMNKIGFDTTPHEDNIWGDPFKSYVGDINGKMCDTGYGVHWEPVARAANVWCEAEAFSNQNLEYIINELKLGNPIIFWGVIPKENIHEYSWYTPGGKLVRVFKETHVRLIIGFIGDYKNPSKIIINDPLSGRIYWNTFEFLDNWEKFNYSGVAIR